MPYCNPSFVVHFLYAGNRLKRRLPQGLFKLRLRFCFDDLFFFLRSFFRNLWNWDKWRKVRGLLHLEKWIHPVHGHIAESIEIGERHHVHVLRGANRSVKL